MFGYFSGFDHKLRHHALGNRVWVWVWV
jgi:hypothetical protein